MFRFGNVGGMSLRRVGLMLLNFGDSSKIA